MNDPQAQTTDSNGNEKVKKFFNRDFILLWQGQLVSSLGDIAYEIALGFWVLAVTGSTAMMGSLMAAAVIPRIILGPIAGVFVDRGDRRKYLVWMDALRGIAILTVGVLALFGLLQIWMVFAAGIISGICASLFNPAVSSVLPDLVDKKDLQRANSAFSLIHSGSGIIGSSGGGFLYTVLGAPLLFLFNGVSFLISAFTEIFIRVPIVNHPEKKSHFKKDFKDGLSFTWNYKGLRYLFISAAAINFFASIGFILILPLFQQSANLGAVKYGFAMAALTAGMVIGMVLLSFFKVKPQNRLTIFIVSGLGMCLFWIIFPLTEILPLMIVCNVLGGTCNAIVNIFIQTIMQLTIPQHMRGKVFALLGTMSQSLTPIAMAIGGILGEFLPLKFVIAGSFSIMILFMLPMLFFKDFREFMRYDSD